MPDTDRPSLEPLVFGEVLFDHFPDGSRVLGGAPFNVAWHLQGFGLHPLFVSAVGGDETGQEVLHRMEEWGMRTTGVQVTRRHPTGRVTAKVVDGEPVFEIGGEQAYDYVEGDVALDVLTGAAPTLVYHGTLALRAEVSRNTLSALLDATRARTFVDLNLRKPWWTRELLDTCLEAADWLKLNRDELATVTEQGTETLEACKERARGLADSRRLGAVIVTLGAGGSLLVRNASSWVRKSKGIHREEMVDTVGAGDAFSAVACVGMVEGWTPENILQRGNAFAGEICRIRGATTRDRSIYERHLDAWRRA